MTNITDPATTLDRLIRDAGSDPALYASETFAYWLAQGWSPARIVREILGLRCRMSPGKP